MKSFLQLFTVMVIGLMETGCAITPALHVIGVYEGQSSVGVDEKEIVVNVSDDSRPIVLALTAYDRTLWKVSLGGEVKLTKVILAGYHAQRVSGIPPETPIETYTYDPSPCDRCRQGAKYFYSYQGPPAQLKEITGLEVTSFQGGYKGTEFSITPGTGKIE